MRQSSALTASLEVKKTKNPTDCHATQKAEGAESWRRTCGEKNYWLLPSADPGGTFHKG